MKYLRHMCQTLSDFYCFSTSSEQLRIHIILLLILHHTLPAHLGTNWILKLFYSKTTARVMFLMDCGCLLPTIVFLVLI